MDREEILSVFKIDATTVNQNTLAQHIADDLEKHQFSVPNSWAEFTITAVSPLPQQTDNNVELLNALNQATECYDQLYVSADVTGTSIPLLARVKQSFHQLVLFYVNKLGEKQTRFNDRILRVVNPLVRKQLQQEAEIAELKEQITQLQAKITSMEEKL